jgi:hypothetical protein
MPPNHTAEKAFAKQMGVTLRTLQNKRRKAKRTGKPLVPPWVEFGRNVYYPDDATAEWLKQQRHIPGARR